MGPSHPIATFQSLTISHSQQDPTPHTPHTHTKHTHTLTISHSQQHPTTHTHTHALTAQGFMKRVPCPGTVTFPESLGHNLCTHRACGQERQDR